MPTNYIGMHVFPNDYGSGKILEDRNAIEKNVLTNEQDCMVYMYLPVNEYFGRQKVLNLVIDQYKRTTDLYFNVKIYASHPFVMRKAEDGLKYKYDLRVEEQLGGGVPSDPTFYANPQFSFYLDKTKCFNGGTGVDAMNVILSYESTSGASVKLFLLKANASFKRFTHITEENLFDRETKNSKYKPGAFHMHYNHLPTNLFYTVIPSNFTRGESIGGTLTLESSQPLVVKPLPSEGQGLKRQEIEGEWSF